MAGASRGVGREIAHCLVARQTPVKAMVRSEADRSDLEAMGIQVTIADALDGEAVERVMLETPIKAVISTIGGLPKDGERSDYRGNRNLVDAAVKAEVAQFILISSIGSGNSAVALPPQVLQTLGPVLVEKEQAETHLMQSGLTYTIVRPGGLKSEPATGNGLLTEDFRIAGSIHRADVAQLVCDCLLNDRAYNKVFSAVDRNFVYPPQG